MNEVESSRFEKLVIIGDRILIKPLSNTDRTKSGLYLPPGVLEKEQVQSGYVIKAGPGYPIPMPTEDEPWKDQQESIKYVPLQTKQGDMAIYLQKGAVEVIYEGEKYVIVQQSSILMLERDEDLLS